jgi:hypothetical protein
MSFKNAAGVIDPWIGSGTGIERWADFVEEYNLKNVDGILPADFAQKNMYFFPDCSYYEASGTTGGRWTGHFAEIPVLVE